MTQLRNNLAVAQKKLKGEIEWENWETKEGIENYIRELEEKLK